MNKLIKLLNEYAHTYADHYDDTWEEIEQKFIDHCDQCFLYKVADENWIKSLVDDVIISKRYGFIWRLIENKKFKSYRAYKDFIDWDYVKFEYWTVIPSVNWQLYDSILCWLAVNDEPIKLLCSILK